MATFYRTYTVRFDANGGSTAPGSKTKTESAVITTYPGSVTVTLTIDGNAPGRTGYTFLGWSTSASATTATYQHGGNISHTWVIDSASDPATGSYSHTLYAVWRRITYTVQYNAHGGDSSSVPAKQTKQYGTALTLSSKIPTYTGRDFVGWNTQADGSGTAYAAGAQYKTNAFVTLYAQWSQITYPVTYSAGAGTGAPAAQTKTYGTALTLSSVKPTRTNYAFVTWNTKSDGTGTNYAPGATYTVNAALTLYAVWHQLANASIVAPNHLITTSRTVNLIKESASDRVKVTAVFGSSGTLNLYDGTGSSFAWNTSGYGQYLTKAMTGTVSMTITTYLNGSAVGSREKSYSLDIPSYAVTVGTPTLEEHNTVPFSFFVQNRSAIDFSFSSSTSYGASISSRSTSINGETKSGASFTTGTLKSAGTFNYTITVKDSRGVVGTRTGTYSVTAYADPSFSHSVKRLTTDDTRATVTLSQTHTALSGANPLHYTVEYKRTTATTYTTVSSGDITAASGTTTYSLTGLEAGGAYNIRVTVNDAFVTAESTKVLPAADTVVIRAQVSDHSLHFPNHTVFEKSYEYAEGAYIWRTNIDSGSDMNDLLVPGSYRVVNDSTAQSIDNYPSNRAGVVDIYNSLGERNGNRSDASANLRRTQCVMTYTGEEFKRLVTIAPSGVATFGPWRQNAYNDGTTAATLFAEAPTLTAIGNPSTVRATWTGGYRQWGKLVYIAATAAATNAWGAGSETLIGVVPAPERLVALSVAAVGTNRTALPMSVTVRTNGGIYCDHAARLESGTAFTITGVYFAQ